MISPIYITHNEYTGNNIYDLATNALRNIEVMRSVYDLLPKLGTNIFESLKNFK